MCLELGEEGECAISLLQEGASRCKQWHELLRRSVCFILGAKENQGRLMWQDQMLALKLCGDNWSMRSC